MEELKIGQCISDLPDGAENLPDGLEDAYIVFCLHSCFVRSLT